MNREAWQNIVNEARNGDDTLFNRAVTANFNDYFFKSIQAITQDKEQTKEVYITTMAKFWERFVLNQEDLPKINVNGYIFQMAKNAIFEVNRKKQTYKHSFIKTVDTLEIVEKYGSLVIEHQKIESIDEETLLNDKTLDTLHSSIQLLEPSCKQIIEKNILQNISLTLLKAEMGTAGTYNAIVQKKKRCIQMLKKILIKQLQKTSYSLNS